MSDSEDDFFGAKRHIRNQEELERRSLSPLRNQPAQNQPPAQNRPRAAHLPLRIEEEGDFSAKRRKRERIANGWRSIEGIIPEKGHKSKDYFYKREDPKLTLYRNKSNAIRERNGRKFHRPNPAHPRPFRRDGEEVIATWRQHGITPGKPDNLTQNSPNLRIEEITRDPHPIQSNHNTFYAFMNGKGCAIKRFYRPSSHENEYTKIRKMLK